jgi:hypothetical protein
VDTLIKRLEVKKISCECGENQYLQTEAALLIQLGEEELSSKQTQVPTGNVAI